MNRAFNHILGAVSCHQASTVLVQRIKNLKPVSVPNATAVTEQIQSYFSEIEDRVQRTRAHLLVDILIIGILAVTGGKGGRTWKTMG